MNLKDIVWFLCAIALSTSKESDDEAEYAYSSVYRSFDTPTITKKDSTPEDVKISSAPETVYISNPVYETILTQEESKPKPDEGAREITPGKQSDNPSNSNNQVSATATEEKKPVSQSVVQNVFAMPDVPEMTNTSDAATPEVNTSAAPITVPAQTMGYTSPPLTMPIIQPGRLITPGLSAYASSKEDKENEDLVKNSDSESQESEESFDGFSMW